MKRLLVLLASFIGVLVSVSAQAQFTEAEAVKRFGSAHLHVLNQQAETLLNEAKSCVGANEVAKWYFGASQSCPTLRAKLNEFQTSVFAYVSSAQFPIEPVERVKKYSDGKVYDRVMEARENHRYADRNALWIQTGEYAQQIYGEMDIRLNALLSQELARIYMLVHREGNWSSQFYFTLYCMIDPVLTCPRSPQESAIGVRHAHGSTAYRAQNSYVRTFLNVAHILSSLDQLRQEEMFLDPTDIYLYHHTFQFGLMDIGMETNSAEIQIVHQTGDKRIQFSERDRWQFKWDLARVVFSQFLWKYSHRGLRIARARQFVQIGEIPDYRVIKTNEHSRWLKPILERAVSAGVSPFAITAPRKECERFHGKQYCTYQIPEN